MAYVNYDPEKKDRCFNEPMAKFVKAHADDPTTTIYVLEAKDALSTRMLQRYKVNNPIYQFTNNPADYALIPPSPNATKACVDSSKVYSKLSGESAIIIHDGTAGAKRTIPEVHTILRRGIRKVILVCNISTRNDTHSRYFQGRVSNIARRHGYKRIANVKLEPYCQKNLTMKPFMFVFERRPRVVIDLTGEN